jgi:hypothetical protein
MFTTTSLLNNSDWVEVFTAVQRRRRWSSGEKSASVQQTL